LSAAGKAGSPAAAGVGMVDQGGDPPGRGRYQGQRVPRTCRIENNTVDAGDDVGANGTLALGFYPDGAPGGATSIIEKLVVKGNQFYGFSQASYFIGLANTVEIINNRFVGNDFAMNPSGGSYRSIWRQDGHQLGRDHRQRAVAQAGIDHWRNHALALGQRGLVLRVR
jgi:hypothetical protein